MIQRLIMATAFILVPTAASAVTLNLVCGGGGEANRVRSSTGYVSNSYGESATATVNTRVREDFADQVNVEIRESEGRIRLPRTMLPPLHGGDGGWMRLTNIEATDNEITAKAYVNPISRPDIRIDRITGTISISGRVGHFSGQCEAYDPNNVQRRF